MGFRGIWSKLLLPSSFVLSPPRGLMSKGSQKRQLLGERQDCVVMLVAKIQIFQGKETLNLVNHLTWHNLKENREQVLEIEEDKKWERRNTRQLTGRLRSAKRHWVSDKVVIKKEKKDKSGTRGRRTPKKGPHLLRAPFPFFFLHLEEESEHTLWITREGM